MSSFAKTLINTLANLTFVVHDNTESNVTRLYMECTIALVLGLGTVIAAYKIIPYIASFILFFVKFCLCMLLLSFTMHLFKNSELIQALGRLMMYARGFVHGGLV